MNWIARAFGHPAGIKRLRMRIAVLLCVAAPVLAQTPPSAGEIAAYEGLHAAAHEGDAGRIRELIAQGAQVEARDGAGRTALHVAAFASMPGALRALADAGANLDALESRHYDIVTIAAVASDLDVLDTAIELGASAGNITSPYEGTALIAAAHLGHHEVVSRLIRAGAPLDHVNNLGWTALIEAVVLGDGGPAHVETVRALVQAGANAAIADNQGLTPMALARMRGYDEMLAILEAARPH